MQIRSKGYLEKRKICILGAGPAGLTAAINLANAGHPVEVFEKSKACGERLGRMYSFALKHHAFRKALLSWHNFNPAQRCIYPFKRDHMRKRYPAAMENS